MMLVRQCGKLIGSRIITLSPTQSRNLFTHEYWGVDKLNQTRYKHKFDINEDQLRSRARDLAQDEEVGKIFLMDVRNLTTIADTEEDLQLIGNLLQKSLKQGDSQDSLVKLISRFMGLCLSMNCVDLAKGFWRDPDVQKADIMSLKNTRGRYFSLLYDNQLYNDVIEDVVKADPAYRSWEETRFAMASLYHLNTDETFKMATDLLRDPEVGLKVGCLYAYFAFKRNQPGKAYNILTDSSLIRRPTRLSTNLKLLILSEEGRVEDALKLIRTEILSRNTQSRISTSVMTKLITNIKEGYDFSSDIVQEFSKIREALNDVVVFCEESVEDLLLQPMSRMRTHDRGDQSKEEDD